MKKLLKAVGGFAAISSILVGGAFLYISSLDPNQYKEQILAKVKAATGRDLEIRGEIRITLFPHLGLQLEDLNLKNPGDFGLEPFAQVKMARIRIDTLVALSTLGGTIQVGELVLDGLHLNLERDKNGKTNFEEFSAKPKEVETNNSKPTPAGVAPTEPASRSIGKAGLAALAIGKIQLWDSSVKWQDAKSNTRIQTSEMSITIGRFTFGSSVPVTIRANAEFSSGDIGSPDKLDIHGYGIWQAQVKVDAGIKKVEFSEVNLSFGAKGPNVPGGAMEVVAHLKSTIDLQNHGLRVDLDELTLDQLKARFTGAFEASALDSVSQYKGNLLLRDFTLRDALKLMEHPISEPADGGVLNRVGAEVVFSGTNESLTIESLLVRVDDSTLNAKGSVSNFSKPAFSLNGEIDSIDLDRYLPPRKNGSRQPVASPATAAAAGIGLLPVDQLRKLDLNAQLAVANLKMSGMAISNLSLKVGAKNGDVRVFPAQAELYEGSYSGDVRVNVQGAAPVISMDEHLQAVQLGPLLKDMKGDDFFSGKANVDVKLQATGNQVAQLQNSLNGNLSFNIGEGHMKGVNVTKVLQTAFALYKQKSVPMDKNGNQTNFSSLSGTATVVNGLISNQDLVGQASCLDLSGAGTVDMPKQYVDYLLKATVVDTGAGLPCEGMGDLQGKGIPIPVKGSFDKLSASANLKDMLKGVAKERAKEELEKQIEKKISKEKLKSLINDLKF